MAAPCPYLTSFDLGSLHLVIRDYFEEWQLDPFRWIPIQKPSDVPRNIQGCYAAIVGDEVVYVGRSKNLQQRLSRHPRMSTFKSLGAKLYYTKSDRSHFLEQAAILKFSPRLNRTALKPAK